MKKLISLALALVMILSLATVAFANTVTYSPSDAGNFTFTKTYNVEGDVALAETLSFEVYTDADCTQKATDGISVDNVTVSGTTRSYTVTVNYPSYSEVGTYRYWVKEVEGTAVGVTYSNTVIEVEIVVGYNNDSHQLVVLNESNKFAIKDSEGKKTEKYENTFKSGSFSVAKNVTGNMANDNDEFKIKVTLTLPKNKTINTPIKVGGTEVTADEWTNGVYETTLTLSEADGATTFSDIPVGVTVAVAEQDMDDDGKVGNYTYVSTKVGKDDFNGLTIADDTDAAIVVTNEYNVGTNTGIVLDSMPYIILLTLAAAGMFVLLTKKRAREF